MLSNWERKSEMGSELDQESDRPGLEIEQPSMRRPRTTAFRLNVTHGEAGVGRESSS
jgi:hypothetical protein